MRQRILWILVSVVALISAARLGYAQALRGVPLNAPRISGQDLAFVVEGRSKGQVTGHFEVRIDGNWVPLASGPSVQPLSMR